MFDSAVLEVAIGLAFVYTLLSVVCTALSELIAQAFATRAATLEKWVRQVIANPPDFYKDPLVRALAGPELSYKSIDDMAAKAGHLPLTGWDKTKRFIKRVRQAHLLPSYIPARTFAMTALKGLAATDGRLTDEQVDSAPEYLRPLIRAAGNELEEARKNIEAWYDDAMQRVTGWYKRNAQVIVMVLAVLVAATLNADSIVIARVLWNNDTVREAVVATAEQRAQQESTDGGGDVGAAAEPVTTPDDATAEPTATPSETPLTKAKDVEAELGKLDLPIGWDGRPDSGEAWATKIAGLVMTALALSLGAPFWFDMLGKLVNLRGAGKLPQAEGQDTKKDG